MKRALVALAVFFATSDARAFCRTTTIEIDPTIFTPTTATPCWTEGIPLWWRDDKTSYAIQKDASTQVSLAQAEDTMALAFSQWSGAMCTPTEKTSLEVRFGGPTPNRLDPTDHVSVVMFDDDAWPHQAPKTTLALTTVSYDTKTGEILDADLELNTANVKLSTTDTVPATGDDFESIVTHESGHFLGLAHSIDPKATMFASYTPGTKSLRTLTADDVDGICAIYPPRTGCSCTTAPSSADTAFAAFAALALLAVMRRTKNI